MMHLCVPKLRAHITATVLCGLYMGAPGMVVHFVAGHGGRHEQEAPPGGWARQRARVQRVCSQVLGGAHVLSDAPGAIHTWIATLWRSWTHDFENAPTEAILNTTVGGGTNTSVHHEYSLPNVGHDPVDALY